MEQVVTTAVVRNFVCMCVFVCMVKVVLAFASTTFSLTSGISSPKIPMTISQCGTCSRYDTATSSLSGFTLTTHVGGIRLTTHVVSLGCCGIISAPVLMAECRTSRQTAVACFLVTFSVIFKCLSKVKSIYW